MVAWEYIAMVPQELQHHVATRALNKNSLRGRPMRQDSRGNSQLKGKMLEEQMQ